MVVHPGLTAISAVSVEEDPGSSCNGVIVKVSAAEIPAFDAREAGYNRLPLRADRVRPLRLSPFCFFSCFGGQLIRFPAFPFFFRSIVHSSTPRGMLYTYRVFAYRMAVGATRLLCPLHIFRSR